VLTCARCATDLTPGEGNFYLVQILAVADPSPPRFSEEDLTRDVESEIQSLLARVRGKSETELMDQVYRREIFHLCTPCYRRWIARPVADC
jgi:hypothetical protein